MSEKERYLTVKQVAEMLQVHFRTVHNRIKSGEIPAVKTGRQWRIPESALRERLKPRDHEGGD